MFNAMGRYFQTLASRFGGGWNRFWFTPSDPFSLGTIRVFTGLILLYVHLTYCYDLHRLFGDEGLMPVPVVEQIEKMQSSEEDDGLLVSPARVSWSYLNYFSRSSELAVLHGLGFVVLALFTVGLFTRVSCILTLLVVLSYIHRAPFYVSELEPILALVVFYLCLAPSGGAVSVDRFLIVRKEREVLRRQDKSGQPIALPAASVSANIAVRLLQVHLSLIFLMMALGKLGGPNPPAAWWTGEAVWWLLAKVETRPWDLTGLGKSLETLKLVDAWTHAIVWFELLFGILVWNRLARPLMLGLAVVLWATLISLATGLFTFVLMILVANLAFVSPDALRAAAQYLLGPRRAQAL